MGLWPFKWLETGPQGSEGGAERRDSKIRASHQPKKVDAGAPTCSEMLQRGPGWAMPSVSDGRVTIFHEGK